MRLRRLCTSCFEKARCQLRSARCLARCVNRGYVTGCHTATFQWHLISSFYDYLPWARDGVAVANEPWSGHYEITSPTWSLAHTTQFAKPGKETAPFCDAI